jgi:hypothetical protein
MSNMSAVEGSSSCHADVMRSDLAGDRGKAPQSIVRLELSARALRSAVVVSLAIAGTSCSLASRTPPTHEPPIRSTDETNVTVPGTGEGRWPKGIFGKRQAEFPPSLGYRFKNIWRGLIHCQRVVVHAGVGTRPTAKDAYRSTGEGVVLLIRRDPETGKDGFANYTTPIPGPVRIESANGPFLTLMSAEGERALFDVASGTFHEVD